MAWLQSMFGDGSPGLTLVLIVLGLAVALVLLFWVFRKIAGDTALKPGRSRQPRLSVTDAAIVDDKRRLVLVRRDNVEHLVMIGGPTDFVIETSIIRAQPAAAVQAAAPPETAPAARPTQPRDTREPARAEPRSGATETGPLAATEAAPAPAAAPSPAVETETPPRFARPRGEAVSTGPAAPRWTTTEAEEAPRRGANPPSLDEAALAREPQPADQHDGPAAGAPAVRAEPPGLAATRAAPTRPMEGSRTAPPPARLSPEPEAPRLAPEPVAPEAVQRRPAPTGADSMEAEMQRLLDELAGHKQG
ncbi:MAG: hypothetical protein BroJett030_00070 [Alphaproteobacteria bacterium]|nr:MAG: hypothetical protein BroJett030_00070 [Alphaproteobacteria bacterium]